MAPDKLDQLDLDVAASLTGFVAAPEVGGLESRIVQLHRQRGELLAGDGREAASTSGSLMKGSKESLFLERLKVDRRHRQEALTTAPLPCIPQPRHERQWEKLEACRGTVSDQLLREELHEFMRKRLASLQVIHGQVLKEFRVWAACSQVDSSLADVTAFQARASWYEAAIDKAAAACVRLEDARTSDPAQNSVTVLKTPLRSPVKGPNVARSWSSIQEVGGQTDDANVLAEELREMLRFRTFEQACEQRVQQLLFHLQWLPVAEGRQLAEQVRQKLTEVQGSRSADVGGQETATTSSAPEDLEHQPLSLQQVDARLNALAADSNFRIDEMPLGRVQSKPVLQSKSPVDSLEAQGTALAMQVKDAFPELFQVQEARARPLSYPDQLLTGAKEHKSTGIPSPMPLPKESYEDREWDKAATYLVQDTGLLATEKSMRGTDVALKGKLLREALAPTTSPAPLGTTETLAAGSDETDKLVRSILAPPLWSRVLARHARLEAVSQVDTGLQAEYDFLSVASWQEAASRVQELAKQHSKMGAPLGIDPLKRQFLQTAKAAAAAHEVREGDETSKASPAKMKPLLIQGLDRERAGSLASPKTPKRGTTAEGKRPTAEGKRPLSGRARAETLPSKVPPSGPHGTASPQASGRQESSRPPSSASSVELEAPSAADCANGRVPSRKLEALYCLRLLKARRLKLGLLHATNVVHSLKRQLLEDAREDCQPASTRVAVARDGVHQLVKQYLNSDEADPTLLMGDEGADGDGNLPAPGHADPKSSSAPTLRSNGTGNRGKRSSMSGLRTPRNIDSTLEGGETQRSDQSNVSHRYSSISTESENEGPWEGKHASRRVKIKAEKGESSKCGGKQSGEKSRLEGDGEFDSRASADTYKWDDVLRCLVVKDANGLNVVYSGALCSFEELSQEVLRIATACVQHEAERLNTEAAEVGAVGSIDRCGVVLEFLELEAHYMAAKLDLLLSLFAAYQHARSSPDDSARLRSEIVGVMGLRPSVGAESVGREGLRQVYREDTALLRRMLEITTSVKEAQVAREAELTIRAFPEDAECGPCIGLPCPFGRRLPAPSVALVGRVLPAVRAIADTLATHLRMDGCQRAQRALRAVLLERTVQLWEVLGEEPNIRKGLVPHFEPPSFSAHTHCEPLKESLILDNPTALDSVVTSCLPLLGRGAPGGDASEGLDQVCMTPMGDPFGGFRSPGRGAIMQQSLPSPEHSGRMRSATVPHLPSVASLHSMEFAGRSPSASVSGPPPGLSSIAGPINGISDSLVVNTSQEACSPGHVPQATSIHGEMAPASLLDLVSRALEVQRLRAALMRALQQTELLEGVYKAQGLALGMAVSARALEPLFIQDGLGVPGKPQRVLGDLEEEVRTAPEDLRAPQKLTMRWGPKLAVGELDLDLLEFDFHTPAGVHELLLSAHGASRLRLAVQAQLVHVACLEAALQSNGILLEGILRSVHHKKQGLLRKNATAVAATQIGALPSTAEWSDFEATLAARQQLLRSASKGWQEQGRAGTLRAEQEEEVAAYRAQLTQELGDLFLSVNKVKHQVRLGVLDSFTKQTQVTLAKRGGMGSLRTLRADLKAELIEEYAKGVFQDLTPFLRAVELAEDMTRLGRLALAVQQASDAFTPTTPALAPAQAGAHPLPLFPSAALLPQAVRDFCDLWEWGKLGTQGVKEKGASSDNLPLGDGGPILPRTGSSVDSEEEFGARDPLVSGLRRFGLSLLDENGKLAQVWACYGPLEALRMAATQGLGVSEIGEGVEAVAALADILKIRWATISLTLPRIESPLSARRPKAQSAVEAAAREVAFGAAQKLKAVFWQEVHGLKEETEHIRLKVGGKAAVSFLQLKRTMSYWRHVLVLQACSEQLVKARNGAAAQEVTTLLADALLLVERPLQYGEGEGLPGTHLALLRCQRDDTLHCVSISDGLPLTSAADFITVKGSAALELPRPTSSRPLARMLTTKEALPCFPRLDTWLVAAYLPAAVLSLPCLSEEERRLLVAEDKRVEHSLDSALGDDRGYAHMLPCRVTGKQAYHLELRLVHAACKAALGEGERSLEAAKFGPKHPLSPTAGGKAVSEPSEARAASTCVRAACLPSWGLQMAAWWPGPAVLSSSQQAAQSELFSKLVVKPLGDISFAASKAAEPAQDGSARLVTRPPSMATRELSTLEAEVWKMKHVVDRHCLEGATISLERECSQLLIGARGSLDANRSTALWNVEREAASFIKQLSSLGLVASLQGLSADGPWDEREGCHEWQVRDAAEAFVEHLVSRTQRQQAIVHAAVYARVQELARSLLVEQEKTRLVDWERSRERRQHTAMKEAEVCDRGMGLVSELDFLRRKLSRLDSFLDDYAQRVRADVEAELAEKMAALERDLVVQRSNFDVLKKETANDMLQAFADIKNEAVLKILSYRGEEGRPGAAAAAESPQVRLLQLEAQLQEQAADNAELRASITKLNTISKLRVLTLGSKFSKAVRAVRKERSVLDLEAWDARERAQTEGRVLKEQLAATRVALATSEEELRQCTKDLAHVKQSRSRLLQWKVANSASLELLEQHDTRVAEQAEARQAAKLRRLSSMAGVLTARDAPDRSHELEAEIERLEHKLSTERALRRRAEDKLASQRSSEQEAEREHRGASEEDWHARFVALEQQHRRLQGETAARQTSVAPPSESGNASSSLQASTSEETINGAPGTDSLLSKPPRQAAPHAERQPDGGHSSERLLSPSSCLPPASYGQSVSTVKPVPEIVSPRLPYDKGETGQAAPAWTFAPSSLSHGATLQYWQSSRPQSASEASKGRPTPRLLTTSRTDKMHRPSTAVSSSRKLH